MKRLIPLIALVAPAFAEQAAPAVEMRPLFNGKDLTGWHGDGYAVEEGAIVCTPSGKNLVTNEIFANYVLEFQFKLPPGGNNGIGLNYPGTGDSAYTGLESQVLDHTDAKYDGKLEPTQFHGSLYTLVPAKQEGLKPVGEWNHERITVNGPNVRVELNGIVILEANLDKVNEEHPKHEGAKRRSGHIAFLGHGDRVMFKDVKIGEIKPAQNEATTKDGFKQIFDGKSLAGWKPEKNGDESWDPVNGILKHIHTAKNPGELWTEQEYGDFEMAFDWRWAAPGPEMERPIILPDGSEKLGPAGANPTIKVQELDSGIYLRGSSKSQVNLWNWPVGSGEVYGYRTDKKQPLRVRAGVTPKEKADKPVGEWNHMVITMKGELLTVVLNGKKVISEAKLPGVPAKGKLALQHHGASIDFANIAIREL